MASTSHFLPIWYDALNSPLGLKVRSAQLERLRAVLYSARVHSHDESLRALSIRTSPVNPHTELWIVPTDVFVEAQASPLAAAQ